MKSRSSTLAFVFACFFAALLTPAAKAFAENSYYRLGYTILEDPSDPSSDVLFNVVMEMSESDRDGNWVGWHIDTLYFRQPLQGGGEDVWKTDLYDIDSADGLWWVFHEKPDTPNAEEFDSPPTLSGEAPPLNSQLAEPLEFLFYGKSGTHAPGKAKVGYTFTKSGNETPEAEDDDDDAPITSDPPLPIFVVPFACESESAEPVNGLGDLSKLLNLSEVDLHVEATLPSSQQAGDRKGESRTTR